MKRILFALIIMICACTSVCAQSSGAPNTDNYKCLKFRGVPMNQSVQALTEVLTDKGYNYDNKEWDKRWNSIRVPGVVDFDVPLSGDYAGFDNCHIIVQDSTIWKGPIGTSFRVIHVLLPETESINTLTDQYNSLRSKLSNKYPGVFDESKIPKHIKDFSVGAKECISDYYPEYGKIELSILRLDDKHAVVVVSYLNTPKPQKDHFEEEL